MHFYPLASVETGEFTSLLIVVLLAFLVPLALSHFRKLPVVVGEILAGILIGGSGFRLVSGNDPTLSLLAEIGFAFLMFLSGLEIDFNLLLNPPREGSLGIPAVKNRGGGIWYTAKHPHIYCLLRRFLKIPRDSEKQSSSFGIAALVFLLTLLLAGAVSWIGKRAGLIPEPWIMILILSTTSLGIVVPVLKERGMSASHFGQSLLLLALFADFLTMFMITVYVAVQSSGLTFDILLIGVLFAAFLLVYRLGARHINRPSVRKVIEDLSGATSQIKVRGAMALMMAFVVLAEFLSVELILGAFLAGVIASLLSTHQDEDMRHKLDAIGFGFFIPVFFIEVGVQFDLSALLSDRNALLLTPLLLLAAFLIKVLAALPLNRDFSWRETLAGGMLLSARLSLIIAASAIGMRLGVISPSLNAAIVLTAALTATLSPLAFNLIMPAKLQTPSQRILVFGQSPMALQTARELNGHGAAFCFVETNPQAAQRLRDQGMTVIHHLDLASCLETLGQERVQAFLALAADEQANLQAAGEARQAGIQQVIALANDPQRIPEYQALGVQTYTPARHGGAILAMMARNPDMYQLLTSTSDERDVREVYLHNPSLAGILMREVPAFGDLLILSIRRDGEMLIPHGSTRLELGDRLTVLGSLDTLEKAQDWFEFIEG